MVPIQTNSIQEDLEIVEVMPECCVISCWRNFSFAVWGGQATGKAARTLTKLTPRLLKRYPGGHSHIGIVLHGLPLPTEEAQVEFAQAIDSSKSGLMCNSVIVEGSGFWASSLKSLMTRIRLDSGNMLLNVFSSIDETAEWVSEFHSQKTAIKVSKEELVEAVSNCRSQSLHLLNLAD